MSEAENQVDLDFGDAQETEVNFPDTEESQGQEQSRAPEPSEADQEDNFSKAETATQKRINNLTKRMREAERQREEALRYAQSVQSEAQQIRQRMEALDTNYVSEYTNRVQSQTEYAEKELARAIEMGDSAAVIEAQRKITSLAIEADRARQAQMQQERYRQQLQAQQAAQVQQPMPQQQPRRPDPKAETWAARNTWFGQDEAMTYAAFGIHKKLVEDEGFDPQSDDYYTELDQRIAAEFPHKLGAATKTESNRRPAQTVAPASRGNSGRRSGKSVRLSPSQVAIAKKLGVPLEEYAKYVKE
jgi:hypothetical protein